MLMLNEQAWRFESLTLTWRNGGVNIRIIAFVAEADPLQHIPRRMASRHRR
jgi:hypothetical protein